MTNLSTETLFDETETANSKQIAILKKHFPQCFDKDGHFQPEKMMEVAQQRMNLSARSYHRILRVARTIADLSHSPNIEITHLSEALSYRQKI